MRKPVFVLAGTHSGVGKTTLALGLMEAFSRRVNVQPFKSGPDYLDTALHSLITGNPSRNLDGWMLDEGTVQGLFVKNSSKADLCLIEGAMGLYDGSSTGGNRGSTAHLAHILGAPVFLVIDASGMAASAAALVLGYKNFDPRLKITGVIANRVSGEKHYLLVKEAIEQNAGVPVLGYLASNPKLKLPGGHPGLVPGEGMDRGWQKTVKRVAIAVSSTIDLEKIDRLAAANGINGSSFPALEQPGRGEPFRLAVAKDRAFNFYYHDNLELLEAMGAELLYFSPLTEERLPPDIDGILLGGGFPELFARQLQENSLLRKEIRERINSGMPVYAEGGGLMYLSEAITNLEGKSFRMAGGLRGTAVMTRQRQHFGYVKVQITRPNILGLPGAAIRGHVFHCSRLDGGEENTPAYRVFKGEKPNSSWRCGFVSKKMLAAYPHLHFYANLSFAKSLAANCRGYRHEKRRRSNCIKF